MHTILIALVAVMNGSDAEPVLRGATMGTTYHIKYVANPGAPNSADLQVEVTRVLAEVDRQMSTYRPDSELSQFNRAPAGAWFPVSTATAEVVAAAADISDKTNGALDVTVGPLVRLWHFGPQDAAASNKKSVFEPPTEASLRAARQRVGYRHLEVQANAPALRKQLYGIEVDLSSIASGFAIDRLAETFAERGIDDYMIEIGGEVRASGAHADGKPWRVAIERPIVGRRELQMAVPLVNAAIATAGSNRKFFEYAGRRYSHIIDPATGRPVEHALGSVTVVAESCIAADGWDTPLLVLGPERGFECAERNELAALFISNEDKSVAVRATSAWRRRFGDSQPQRREQ